jgi:hypothetical protein
MRFRSNASVPHQEWQIMSKRGSNAKGNRSKSIGCCSYDLHFKIVVIMHKLQTTVKQQESVLSPEAKVQGLKQQKQDIMQELLVVIDIRQ